MNKQHLTLAVTASVCYLLIFVLYTYPLITVFSSAISGSNGGDSAQYLWNNFIFKHQLMAGENLFFTDYSFYPSGANLLFHTYTPLLGLFSLAFDNQFLAINTMLLLQFVLSGLGAYLLSFRFLRHFSLSLLVGFMFAFSPYKMAHFTEHFHLMLTATIPFCILAAWNAFRFDEKNHLPRIQSWTALMWLFGLLLLTFFSDYYSTFYVLFFLVLFLLFPWLKNKLNAFSKRTRWIALISFFMMSHIIINQLMLHGVNDNAAFWWQPDVTGFFVPSFISFFFETNNYYLLYNSAGASLELPVFLGWSFVLMFLATLYIDATKKQTLVLPIHFTLFLCLTLFFMAMTVPEIQLFDKSIFYLPTGFYYITPFFNNIRIPGRASVMVYLFLPMLLGYLWMNIKPVIPAWIYTWAPVLCLLLLSLEFLPHAYPMQNRAEQEEVNRWLKEKKGVVLLALPLGVTDGFHKLGVQKTEYLIDQTVHHKKTIGGYISRVPSEVFRSYSHDALCRTLFVVQKEKENGSVPLMDTKDVAQFMSTFQPDLIYIPKEYQHSNLHRFILQNFSAYIETTEALNGHTLYTLHSSLVAK